MCKVLNSQNSCLSMEESNLLFCDRKTKTELLLKISIAPIDFVRLGKGYLKYFISSGLFVMQLIDQTA